MPHNRVEGDALYEKYEKFNFEEIDQLIKLNDDVNSRHDQGPLRIAHNHLLGGILNLYPYKNQTHPYT